MKEQTRQAVITGEHLLQIPPVETHILRAKHVQQTYKIDVMRPARKKGDTRRFPVVYVTDGNWVFDMFKSISYLLQMHSEDAPPYILVGISYPSDSPFAGMLLRAREYSFPPYPLFDVKSFPEFIRTAIDGGFYEGTLVAEEGTKDFYGAEDFRNFIAKELIPFIDEKYETLPGERTYFGHSGGGYFGLYTLFSEPEVFKNYIVSSPGLLYDGVAPGGKKYENYDCGPQMARTFIESGRSLQGVKLYMSAGADEEFESALGPWQLVSGFYQMAKLMKNAAIPGLELMTEVFPNETHISVWPTAFIHGVQAMLGTRRVVRSVYFKDRR